MIKKKKIKFKIILTIFNLLLLTSYTYADDPCGTMYPIYDTTSWGVGFIKLPYDINIICHTIHDNSICFINEFNVKINNNELRKIEKLDYILLGTGGNFLLKVYEIKDTKFKICINTIPEGIWIEFDELNNNSLCFNTYRSILNKKGQIKEKFLKTINRTSIGVNLLTSCLYLRDKPSKDSEIITCLNSNNGEKTTEIVVHEFDGKWAYVTAYILIYDPEAVPENIDYDSECVNKVVTEYKGFLKAIDDSGRPNIWYAVSAY